MFQIFIKKINLKQIKKHISDKVFFEAYSFPIYFFGLQTHTNNRIINELLLS